MRVLRVTLTVFFLVGCAPPQLDQAVESAIGSDDSEPDLDYNSEGNFKGNGRKPHAKSSGLAWQAVGPAPPTVEAPIAVHEASGTIYIASLGGGVLKSTDNGVSFVEVNNGLTSLAIGAMRIVGNDPNQVIVGTANGGVFKTFDGGAHWAITGEVDGFVLAMTVDPTNPNIVYAGYQGDTPIKKSIDGGMTWTESFDGIDSSTAVWNISVDPVNPNVVYCGSSGTGGFKSVDGGATWNPLPIGNPDGTTWFTLLDPADHNTLYVATNGSGVYKSTDAGASFVRIGSPAVGVVLSLAKSGSTLYAGTASGGVSVSNDGGASWTVSSLASGIAIILSTDTTGAVYAGTQLDGVRKTINGGADWTRVGWNNLKDCNCQNGHALAVDPGKDRHVFFTANDGGIMVTQNGGTTWDDGGRRGFTNRSGRNVAFDPVNPNRVYAGAFTGGGLYISDDGGKTWERNLFAGPNMQVTGVAVDPVDESVYCVLMGLAKGIYKSTDFGATFTRIDKRADGTKFNANGRGIAVDPNNHNNVYYAGNNGVWQSTNAGASWTQRSTIFSLTVTPDPTTSSIVYAGTQTKGVLQSTDGGATFHFINNGLPGTRVSRTGGVQVNPRNNNVLYVGTEGSGMFKSTNGGSSWYPISAGLDNEQVFGLRIDPVNPDIVYAATSSSVYKTVSGGE